MRTRNVFMPDPDTPNTANPIHSTEGARSRGFRGALVGGATVYGWAVDAIVESLGEAWLDHGWADVRFRRPVYPTDTLDISISSSGVLDIAANDTCCVEGSVGLGDAPWQDELQDSDEPVPQPAPAPLPPLTPQSVPVGQSLRARRFAVSLAESEAFCRDKQNEASPLFFGPHARLHPAWIASQPIFLLHHSFAYGPAIHTASRIAHMARSRSDQFVTVTGRCIDAFERKGHQYIVNDATLLDSANAPFARIRHTAIYQLKET
ncbi:MAG: MaoC family dehydratase [Gammaproteobacteria bacterium]|nr:MaoC family dehydratase [Gammaproteobacteria bacterium]